MRAIRPTWRPCSNKRSVSSTCPALWVDGDYWQTKFERIGSRDLARPVESIREAHCRKIERMAEREGFEPSIRGYRIHTFQACAFDHSATAPHSPLRYRRAAWAAGGRANREGGPLAAQKGFRKRIGAGIIAR